MGDFALKRTFEADAEKSIEEAIRWDLEPTLASSCMLRRSSRTRRWKQKEDGTNSFRKKL